jgi:tripartite-type tricarboxylate transporter receptor subunit TctC
MAAGGATDILIRTLVPKMTDMLGQQIVVGNGPCANGVIGDELGVKAAPDGCTPPANSLALALSPELYKLNYASYGIGSIALLLAEMFKQASNTQIVPVAYKGKPHTVHDRFSRQTQFMISAASSKCCRMPVLFCARRGRQIHVRDQDGQRQAGGLT